MLTLSSYVLYKNNSYNSILSSYNLYTRGITLSGRTIYIAISLMLLASFYARAVIVTATSAGNSSSGAQNLFIGYYGSDGGCAGEPYARVFMTGNGTIIVLSKIDECNCGCDSLAWIGLSALDEGDYNISVTYVLVEYRGSYRKFTHPYLVIVDADDLYSTGGVGAAPLKHPTLALVAARRIWSGEDVDADVRKPTVKGNEVHKAIIFPLNPRELVGKKITLGACIHAEKVDENNYKITLMEAWVKIGSEMIKYRGNGSWPSVTLPHPWVAFYARTGYLAESYVVRLLHYSVKAIKIFPETASTTITITTTTTITRTFYKTLTSIRTITKEVPLGIATVTVTETLREIYTAKTSEVSLSKQDIYAAAAIVAAAVLTAAIIVKRKP